MPKQRGWKTGARLRLVRQCCRSVVPRRRTPDPESPRWGLRGTGLQSSESEVDPELRSSDVPKRGYRMQLVSPRRRVQAGTACSAARPGEAAVAATSPRSSTDAPSAGIHRERAILLRSGEITVHLEAVGLPRWALTPPRSRRWSSRRARRGGTGSSSCQRRRSRPRRRIGIASRSTRFMTNRWLDPEVGSGCVDVQPVRILGIDDRPLARRRMARLLL